MCKTCELSEAGWDTLILATMIFAGLDSLLGVAIGR